jgi:hypothetical protein
MFYTFRRFDAEFCDVKNALDNGSLGKLQCIKTTTRDSPKPSYTFLKSAGIWVTRRLE